MVFTEDFPDSLASAHSTTRLVRLRAIPDNHSMVPAVFCFGRCGETILRTTFLFFAGGGFFLWFVGLTGSMFAHVVCLVGPLGSMFPQVVSLCLLGKVDS